MNQPTPTAPAWLENILIDGLQMLKSMGLEGAPGHDASTHTLDGWLLACMSWGITWDQGQDEWRLRAAFQSMFGAITKWPQPITLNHFMPGRTPQPSLTPPRSSTIPPDIREKINAFTQRARRPPGEVGRHELLAEMAKHIGASHGVSAEYLAHALRVNTRHIRVLVTELRMEGAHICGTPGEGYYMAECPEDLATTCEWLKSRALKSLLLASRMTKVSIPDLFNQLKLPT
jgi:biotin operon repressor